jgi:hypothetical protein
MMYANKTHEISCTFVIKLHDTKNDHHFTQGTLCIYASLQLTLYHTALYGAGGVLLRVRRQRGSVPQGECTHVLF